MKSILLYSAIFIFSIFNIGVLKAETIPVNGDTADQEIYNDGSKAKWPGQSTARIGGGKADQLSSLVIPFQIPFITNGEVVSSASLSINLKSLHKNLIGNIDVYGLTSSSSSTVRSDYDEVGVLVYDNIITNSTALGDVTVSGTDFADFINDQIANGAQVGDYIFLRLEADSNEDAYNFWDVYTSDGSPQPSLTLETGPAPVTVLATIGDQTSTEGIATTIDISATDTDGTTMVFTLPNKPSFVSITDNGNGTAVINISDQSTIGLHSIEVLVTAGSNSDTETFSLDVKVPFVNTPPVLNPIGTLHAKTGVAKDFDISATDVDASDVLSFSISGNPTFVTLADNGDGTAAISVSDIATEGVHENILITVIDGAAIDTEVISVSVSAVTVGGAFYCDPINGSMSNNGTSEATAWSTLEAVFSANKTFDDGDIIYLMNGNHGSPQIKSSNTDYVTITSYTGHNPVLTKIQFSTSVSYWKVDNLRFEAYGLNAKASGIINTYAGCNNISISNSYFTSIEDDVVFDYSNGTTATVWKEQTSSGINIIGDNAEVINCEFYNVHFGMRFSGNNITIKDNKITNFYADGIQVSSGCNNTTVTGNIIKNAYVVDEQHDDGIQFWTNKNAGEIKNVIISNNIVMNFADGIPAEVAQYGLASEPMQGIILTDGWANNWIVENNLVVNSHSHGISIYGANDCRIQNNTVIKNPLFEYYQNDTSDPIIQAPNATKPTAKTSANSIVRNNLGTKIATWAFPSNFTVEGNYDIDQSDYNNYLACFVDYENQDFNLKQSSPAVDTGINTDLTTTDLAGDNRLFGANVDAGCYEFSDANLSNSIEEIEGLTVYPNPVSGNEINITLANTSKEDQTVKLVSLTGRVVYSSVIVKGETKHQISNVGSFSKGVYLLQIINSTKSTTKKIIID
ncbi:MAG: T9SS type A sorting domain-containing protein [Chlamydiia bacterium]|nr:T9SS type A sorting domain-containing protein [Chlamydiia bacterium]